MSQGTQNAPETGAPANGGQQADQQAQNGGQQGTQGSGAQNGGQNGSGTQQSGQPDFAEIIRTAVAEAVKPFQQAEEQRAAETAARTITDTVMAAAKDRFHDATDAVTGIDLTQVTDGNGQPDTAKIKAAVDELLVRKPHLAKPGGRQAPPAAGASQGGATAPLDDRVKDTLARMQSSVGIKPTT